MIDGWEQGRAWADWQVDPDTFNERGVVFGGYLATLVDSMAGVAFITTLEDSQSFATVGLNVSFFRPVSTGSVRLEASVVHRGRRTGHVEVSGTDESGRLIVRGVATQVVIGVPGVGVEPTRRRGARGV